MKWFAGALVVLLIGAFWRLGYVLYAMYALLGLIVLGRFLTQRWVGGLEVERQCDRSEAQIGDRVEVNVIVRNRGRLSVPWVLLEEAIPQSAVMEMPPRLKRTGHWTAVTKLKRGDEEAFSYELECRMRGCYPIGPMMIETGDLFGLHRRFRTSGEPHILTVFPTVVPLLGWDLSTRKPLGKMRLAHRLFEDPIQISGIRDYQPGDAMNRIHWRATARTGQLQSKTYDPSCVTGAAILLDFHVESLSGEGQVARTELAVVAAASLANAVLQGGQPAGLFTNGRDGLERMRREGWVGDYRTRSEAAKHTQSSELDDRLRPLIIEPRRSGEQMPRILELLARLEPSDGLSFSGLIGEIEGRLPRNANIVAVVQQLDEDSMLLLAGFHRRGFSVTVVQVAFSPRGATPDWALMSETVIRLVAAGVTVRRITDEATLAEACAADWSMG
ncbi:MAG TPA: DUF58 domain-containing protein [Candidatus Limnocylindria bacterium]|nr:DUF58 domain-containing protein [Candidatus Limnocylindria bacterium]